MLRVRILGAVCCIIHITRYTCILYNYVCMCWAFVAWSAMPYANTRTLKANRQGKFQLLGVRISTCGKLVYMNDNMKNVNNGGNYIATTTTTTTDYYLFGEERRAGGFPHIFLLTIYILFFIFQINKVCFMDVCLCATTTMTINLWILICLFCIKWEWCGCSR